jgi:hypothetical protein
VDGRADVELYAQSGSKRAFADLAPSIHLSCDFWAAPLFNRGTSSLNQEDEV